MPNYGVLGRLRVEVNGERVDLGGPRRNELLAVLLANRGDPVSLGHLSAALWGDFPPATATGTLRAHVSALRSVLGRDAIATVAGGYRLPARAQCDVDGFVRDLSEARANARAGDVEAARHRYSCALSWWRGQAYENVELQASDIVAERRRLGAMRVDAWRERAQLEVRWGRAANVIENLRRLVEEEPWDEPLVQQLAIALYRSGRQPDALVVLTDLRARLRDEFGLDPSHATRDLERAILRQALPVEPQAPPRTPPPVRARDAPGEDRSRAPMTRYARNGRANIAYQVFGDGPVDLLFLWGTPSNVDLIWDEPRSARFLRRLGETARVISFDKRGMGVSDPTDGDTPPQMQTRLDDALAVMDAADSERAVMLGFSEGGAAAIGMTVEHPDRVSSLILCSTFARMMWAEDHPFGLTNDQGVDYVRPLLEGRNLPIEMYFPSEANDPTTVRWFRKFFQNSASPAMMLNAMQLASQVDVRDLLPKIDVPTLIVHRTGDVTVRVEHARHLAENIPHARLLEIPGTSHWPWLGNDHSDQVLTAIAEHVAGRSDRGSKHRNPTA
ncbi:MAG: alpha/beta fold hydrolase [Nitriliruptorales bacterium]|nr:alpha/beta fold hydrolase [Nitriliruptorales bacterium]